LHEFRIIHCGVVENITPVRQLIGLLSLLDSISGEKP
jgi:hypothetical protein